MTRVRPLWVSFRVPARITCMHCHAVDAAALVGPMDQEAFKYSCDKCGFEVRLSLSELNDPEWRESLNFAKAG
jgi:hypothetical protein